MVRNSFPLAHARNETRETIYSKLVLRVYSSRFRGVSRGANALWSHTARVKNSQHRAKRAGGGKQSGKKSKKKKEKSTEIPRALNSGKKALNDDANISND
jgi:hypothetical protein